MRCILVLVAAIATACSQLRENPELAFEMTTFRAESSPGCVADTAACASFNVTYPVFNGLDTSVQVSINERIAGQLASAPGGMPRTFQGLADDFVADFNSFATENPEFGFGWYYDTNVSVLIASDTLVSLQVDTETFTGGAHGSYTTRFVNVEPMTGTSFLLGALLKDGYEDELSRLAYEDYTRQRDTDSVDPSANEGQFELNDNYGFRKEGIVFFFNAYELGSYAEGPTEILIPYEELRGWFR
jgi:hypothetical protein